MQTDLAKRKCKPCEGGVKPLDQRQIEEYLKQLDSWSYSNGEITKAFDFKNYYETVSFVNAVAWIAHQEDHHPEIDFGYRTCRVSYKTHKIGGISENDFICAAKVDHLIKKG